MIKSFCIVVGFGSGGGLGIAYAVSIMGQVAPGTAFDPDEMELKFQG
jgi:hypothetical protein